MMIAQGTPDSSVQRVIEHVSTVDPAWGRRIRPADRALLTRYIKAAQLDEQGAALPKAYRVFLEAMGLDSGGLFDADKITCGLDELVELYEEFRHFQPDAIRPDLPIVAKYTMGTQISLNLQGDTEPQVVETTDFDCAEFLSRSWEHFLLQAATLYVELRRLPCGLWCARSELASPPAAGVLAALDSNLARWKLTKAWLCDPRHYIAASEDASIYVELSPDGSLFCRVFGADDSRLRALGDEVAATVGAERKGQLRRVEGVLRS